MNKVPIKKLSSCFHWTSDESNIIRNAYENNIPLPELMLQLEGRTEDAIVAQARKLGFGVLTLNGNRILVGELQHKGKHLNKKSTVVKSVEATTTANIEVDNNQHKIIITKKVVNTGKELRLLALDLLFRENLIITDQSVKQTVRLLSLFRKEIA